MPLTVSNPPAPSAIHSLAVDRIRPNLFSFAIYGDPTAEIDDLLESIREHGVLVPLVVVAEADTEVYELVSGHRRLACARALGLTEVPCEVRALGSRTARRRAVLEYNRQRRKTFSQMMREADALEALLSTEARRSRLANLRQFRAQPSGRGDRVSEFRRSERADGSYGYRGRPRDRSRAARISTAKPAPSGGSRGPATPAPGAACSQLDAGTKTIHAAYKDLRRRDRFTTGFRPTPYDVWPFRHDRAFGIPHPGSIPPAIVAHALHYYTDARRPRRRPDGRGRHHARRLRIDGTSLPCV